MRLGRQLANCWLALMLSAGLAGVSLAQRQEHSAPRPKAQSAARPAQRAAAPRAQSAPRQRTAERQARSANRAEGNVDRGYARPDGSRQDFSRRNSERPDFSRRNSERQNLNRQGINPNRPPESQYSSRGANNGIGVGGFREQQNRLSPEERQRVIQNQQRFRQLSPQQQQDMRERGRVWQQMTPQQREHIKNDVLPAWRNLPPQRQKAIEQRLGVLQNMPESARNRHLNDPSFTRGMSEEDRSTLRDLSHLHVGGAPDPPNE